ncbi:serine hydrolase [Arthrobacter zhaoguopingii]|uniref:serine hydrolase n=1 Tax=Arthrobacter zhaoguopingii TaxID=2681491 RepID=UPI00135BFF6C|nr:serine hydrolase [Arthrobacter zhaoguopingii]
MTRRMRITDLTELPVPEQAVLSHDGEQIVYVLRTCDTDRDQNLRRLWTVGAASGDAHQLTRGTSDTAPAWAPDGRRIAFLRTVEGTAQVWTLPASGGEPEQLTSLPLGAGTPVWSPDGTKIAFTAWADAFAGPSEDAAVRAARDAGPVVINRLDYKLDGIGLLRTRRRHVHIVDVARGVTRQLTNGDWDAGDPSWSPDGAKLAFPANPGATSDVTLRTAAYVIDATDVRAKARVAGLDAGTAGPLRWNADGDALLVVGHHGKPIGHASLLKVPLDDGAPVDLSGPLDRNVMSGGVGYPGAHVQLTDGGETALFCARNRGATHLYAVGTHGGTPRLVLGGDGRVVSALSVAGRRAVMVLSTPESFGEIVTVDLDTAEESIRTHHGDTLAGVRLFAREERSFTISDGTTVAAWLVHDPEQSGPRPLLLDIHGGPHNAWNAAADEMHLYQQELVSRGWAVLLVNPRGSDGYGTEFFTGVQANWGEADSADLLEPIDALVAENFADPARLAVTGYSYGGYMTCWLTGRDHRFSAAVAGGVVSDMVSMHGTCEDAHLSSETEMGGPFWDHRAGYERMSPLSRVQDVQTPTLLLHGTDDEVCPVTQAEQWFAALRARGVPTQMVLYPGGGHAFIFEGRPSHRLDYSRRLTEWVERYAGDTTKTARPPLDAAHWQQRLDDLAARHGVIGAQFGILRTDPARPDDRIAVATGVLNVETGAPATPEAVFQIGSISKVWTTTVAMQLVDEGLIGLDAPIVDVLPELKLSDAAANAKVSLRHLLTHTSGIDGDLFTDTGRGDDALEQYVALLADLGQNHPIGATWSYCNSGFSLIGRVIERITGLTWDAVMRERLFKPLGLDRTGTLPEEALLNSAAVGHITQPDTAPALAPAWMLPRSLGPAGLITTDVADALSFARMHLSAGAAADGTQVLSAESVAAMAAWETDLPDHHTFGDSWGLGWIRYLWDGHRVLGHDGATIGQGASLRLLPEQGLAVVLHTNGGSARDLADDLLREVFADVADVAVPFALTPPQGEVDIDITPYVGTYARESVRVEVFAGDDGPRLRTTVLGPLAALTPDPTEEFALVPVAADLFVMRAPESETWTPVTFYSLPTGEPYVHFGARATPRVG